MCSEDEPRRTANRLLSLTNSRARTSRLAATAPRSRDSENEWITEVHLRSQAINAAETLARFPEPVDAQAVLAFVNDAEQAMQHLLHLHGGQTALEHRLLDPLTEADARFRDMPEPSAPLPRLGGDIIRDEHFH